MLIRVCKECGAKSSIRLYDFINKGLLRNTLVRKYNSCPRCHREYDYKNSKMKIK